MKLSVSTFIKKEGAIDKFVRTIDRLRPDVALLAFEKYCDDEAEVAVTKEKLAEAGDLIRHRIGSWTKLKILVAHDIHGFNEFPSDIGWNGHRVRNFH